LSFCCLCNINIGMNDNNLKDPLLWKRKAMAFVTRAHHHLWGKNNEDPLVFLFQMGLSNATTKSLLLGWNKYGQERHYDTWGLKNQQAKNSPGKEDCFFLPPGIVFPHIIEKELKSIWIHSLDPAGPVLMLPGSVPGPILLGNLNNPVVTVSDLFKGLCLFQEKKESLCVKILLPES